jgi:hypothetical protein
MTDNSTPSAPAELDPFAPALHALFEADAASDGSVLRDDVIAQVAAKLDGALPIRDREEAYAVAAAMVATYEATLALVVLNDEVRAKYEAALAEILGTRRGQQTDRFALVHDDELRRLIKGLDAARYCIDPDDFPEEYDAVKTAAEYLAELRERRNNGDGA